MKIGKKSFFSDQIQISVKSGDMHSLIELYPNGYLFKIKPYDKSTFEEVTFDETYKILINENGPFLTIETSNKNFIFDSSENSVSFIKGFFKKNKIEIVEKITSKKIQSTEKTYSVPAIASLFVPGLGQLLKKEFLKAFVYFVIVFVLAFSFWMGLPIVYIVSVYDAYNTQVTSE